MNFGNFGFPQKQLGDSFSASAPELINVNVSTDVIAGDVLGSVAGSTYKMNENVAGGDVILAPVTISMYTTTNTVLEAVRTSKGACIAALSGGNFVVAYANTTPRFRIVSETDLSFVSAATSVAANNVAQGSVKVAALPNGNFAYGFIDASDANKPKVAIYGPTGTLVTAPVTVSATSQSSMDLLVRANNQILVGVHNTTSASWAGLHPNGSIQVALTTIESGFTTSTYIAGGMSMSFMGANNDIALFAYRHTGSTVVGTRAIYANNDFVAAASNSTLSSIGASYISSAGFKYGFSVFTSCVSDSNFTANIFGTADGKLSPITIPTHIDGSGNTSAFNSISSIVKTPKGEIIGFAARNASAANGVVSIGSLTSHESTSADTFFQPPGVNLTVHHNAIAISASHKVMMVCSTAAGVTVWMTNPIYTSYTIPEYNKLAFPGYSETTLGSFTSSHGYALINEKTIFSGVINDSYYNRIRLYNKTGSQIGTRDLCPVVGETQTASAAATIFAKKNNNELIATTLLGDPGVSGGFYHAVIIYDQFGNVLSPPVTSSNLSTTTIGIHDVIVTDVSQHIVVSHKISGATIVNSWLAANLSSSIQTPTLNSGATTQGDMYLVSIPSSDSFISFFQYDATGGNTYAYKYNGYNTTPVANNKTIRQNPDLGFNAPALTSNNGVIIYTVGNVISSLDVNTLTSSSLFSPPGNTANGMASNTVYNGAGQSVGRSAMGSVIGNMYLYTTDATSIIFDIDARTRLYLSNTSASAFPVTSSCAPTTFVASNKEFITLGNASRGGRIVSVNPVLIGVTAGGAAANNLAKIYIGNSITPRSVTLPKTYSVTPPFDTRALGGIKAALIGGSTMILQGV